MSICIVGQVIAYGMRHVRMFHTMTPLAFDSIHLGIGAAFEHVHGGWRYMVFLHFNPISDVYLRLCIGRPWSRSSWGPTGSVVLPT